MKPSLLRTLSLLLFLTSALLLSPGFGHAGAEWVAVEGVSFNTNLSLADNLKALKGKYVEVNLASGSSVAGTVVNVGAAALHLKQISGKEAYDALIPLDKITAIEVRFRTLERK